MPTRVPDDFEQREGETSEAFFKRVNEFASAHAGGPMQTRSNPSTPQTATTPAQKRKRNLVAPGGSNASKDAPQPKKAGARRKLSLAGAKSPPKQPQNKEVAAKPAGNAPPEENQEKKAEAKEDVPSVVVVMPMATEAEPVGKVVVPPKATKEKHLTTEKSKPTANVPPKENEEKKVAAKEAIPRVTRPTFPPSKLKPPRELPPKAPPKAPPKPPPRGQTYKA